jgi:hypothetical protein
MSAVAAIAFGRASPLAGSNAVRNQVSVAPIVRRRLCLAVVPLARSEAAMEAQPKLDGFEQFAIQIADGKV